MKRISLLRTAPAALWLTLLAVALVGTGYWAINARADEYAESANDVARDDAVGFAEAAGRLAGYELSISISDADGLLANPLLATPTPQGCQATLAPFGDRLAATIFHRGETLCSNIDPDAGIAAWAEKFWAEKSASGHFEVHGARGVGEGTFATAPEGNLAVAVRHGELGLVALVPIEHELTRHLNSFGDRALAVGLLDRSGTLIGALDRNGPLDTAGENMGDVDGSLLTGPGGVVARWAKGPFGQRFGALVVGVNPAPTDEHLALFQNRSRLVALGVVVFGLFAIGAVVVWGARALRRVATLVEAAADGTTTDFEVPRHAPAEVARLTDTLRHLGRRRRRYDIERERARQSEAAALGLELHDDIIQRLAAASMLGSTHPELAERSLAETAERIRNLSAGLCPPVLAAAGLAAAVAELRTDGTDLVVVDDTGGARFDAPVERVVYRNVVEAVRNACKHGAATRVEVTVAEEDGQLHVTVDDNGCGIDPAMCSGRDGHFGIVSMQALMARLGGAAVVEPTGAGTRVTLSCPVATAPTGAATRV